MKRKLLINVSDIIKYRFDNEFAYQWDIILDFPVFSVEITTIEMLFNKFNSLKDYIKKVKREYGENMDYYIMISNKYSYSTILLLSLINDKDISSVTVDSFNNFVILKIKY